MRWVVHGKGKTVCLIASVLLTLLVLPCFLTFPCFSEKKSSGSLSGGSNELSPLDFGEAVEVCDASPLQPAEGIWEFPDEHMSVLIRRRESTQGNHAVERYLMTVIDTPDVRLTPGDTVGWLEESGAKGKYVMTLFTKRSAARMMRPAKLLAELSADESVFKVKAEKWNVKLNLSPVFKNLWRVLKLQYDDPVRNLPASMVRVYPSVYTPGEKERIRYL